MQTEVRRIKLYFCPCGIIESSTFTHHITEKYGQGSQHNIQAPLNTTKSGVRVPWAKNHHQYWVNYVYWYVDESE